jgi:hypothetical protein
LAEVVDLVVDWAAGAAQRAGATGPGGVGAEQQVGVPVAALIAGGRQVPAEQFAMLCDRALEAGGALMGMFRELATEREARRREVAAECWRERFRGGSDTPAEAIAVPEAALSKLAEASLASSDRSMERRPFVRMVGTFASAAMLEALGVDLLNLLRAMQGSRVSGAMSGRQNSPFSASTSSTRSCPLPNCFPTSSSTSKP